MEKILRSFSSESSSFSSLMLKVEEFQGHRVLLNKLSQDLEVLRQHLAERDEIIALYTSKSSAPAHLLRRTSR